MQKSANIEYPVSALIQQRRSIRAFAGTPIEPEKIFSLFEATRWAPSSSNEQPWMYIYATKEQPELWNILLQCLNTSNQVWAKDAPLIILSLARKHFSKYATANSHALYDLGGANSFLAIQAVELGLQVRQVAGFDEQKAIDDLRIPASFDLGVFIVVGYPGDPENLPEKLKLREMAPRERYIQQEFVMNRIF